MKNDIVSIIIPCYNHGHYLSRAIDSVLSQDSDNYELIVVNDGSTDDTSDIVKQYITHNPSRRILLIEQENGGPSKARNVGISNAKGEYILLLDADDWISSSYVSEGLDFFGTNEDYVAFRPIVQWHNIQTKEFGYDGGYSNYRNMLLYGQNCQLIMRKGDILSAGGFDESMRDGIEDWEFFIRYLYGEKKIYNSRSVLYHYQKNAPEGSLSQKAGEKSEEVLRYLYLKHFDIYNQYFGNPILLARYKEQHLWADRKLPQFAKRIQLLWQKVNQNYQK